MRFLTVNYQSVPEIGRLRATIAQEPGNHELWVVDNGQERAALQALAVQGSGQTPMHILDAGRNLGFGRACNRGLKALWAAGRSPVWLINPDAWLGAGAIAAVESVLGEIAIVGTTWQDEGGERCFAGGQYDRFSGRIWEEPTPEPQWVSGASMVLNLAQFRECPQFDEDFFLYYEDFEFCQRYRRQGYRLGLVAAPIYHCPSSITGRVPLAKIRWQTAGYLMALHKAGFPWALVYRLGRLALAGLRKPKNIAAAQAAGIQDYLSWAMGFNEADSLRTR